jgi:hypothetical protein
MFVQPVEQARLDKLGCATGSKLKTPLNKHSELTNRINLG